MENSYVPEVEIDIEEPPKFDDTSHILNSRDFLHCVSMISNPCGFKKRYSLAKDYLKKMEKERGVIQYLVEIVYGNQSFAVTDPKNKRHLQIRTQSPPLWIKENAINIGVKKLLPKNWKYLAWIDADIEFENPHWAEDAVKLLDTPEPNVVQLWSHALDLNKDEDPMTIFQSFGHEYKTGKTQGRTGLNFWHSGYAWSCNRIAWDKMGGLYEHSILGSGDFQNAMALIGKASKSYNGSISQGYKNDIAKYENKVKGFKLGYVPVVIRHFFHGSKVNRNYQSRWLYLCKHKYDPSIHLTKEASGLLVPTKECPQGLVDDIMKYFQERLEDD